MQRSPNPVISYWAVHGAAALAGWPWTIHGAPNCPIFCNCSEFSLTPFAPAAPPFSIDPAATCLEPAASLGSHPENPLVPGLVVVPLNNYDNNKRMNGRLLFS